MSKRPAITAEDLETWLGNPVTEAVMARMKEVEAAARAFWVRRLTSDTADEPLALAFLQVELRAKLEIIEDLLSLTVEDIEEENADSTRERIGKLAEQAAKAAQGKGR